MEGKELPVSQMLQEVASSRTKAHWKTLNNRLHTVTVKLPYGCEIEGMWNPEGDEMFVADFAVNPLLQKNGIGTRLLRSLAAEAKKNRVTTLRGNFVNESALRAQANAFGAEHVRVGGLSYVEALQKIQADERIDTHTTVDLSFLETNDWELPTTERE